MGNEITDPALEGFSPEAFEEPGEGGLTAEQFAFRVHAKREQAQQDAGWLEPPGPDAPLEPLEQIEDVPDEPEAPTESEVDAPEGEEPEASAEEELGAEGAPEVEAEVDDETWQELAAQYDALARYKNPDEADRGFSEKDRTIQRLYQELNERQELAQQFAEQQQQQQGPQQIDVQAWSEWASEVVDQGGGIQGANRALAEGGPQGFDIYMAHWLAVDDPEERVQATAFNNEVQRQFAAQQALAAVQPHFEQSQERNVAEQAMMARQVAASQRSDFEDYAEEMDRLVETEDGPLPPETKQWLAEMANSGVEGKVRAWDYLYLAAVASRGPRRQKASELEIKRRTASADRAKIAATVSTSEGSGARTPPSEAELRVIRKKNAIREKLGQPLLDES